MAIKLAKMAQKDARAVRRITTMLNKLIPIS
jgi:hypothetical protein